MTYKFKVDFDSRTSNIIRFYPPSRSHVINFEPDVIRKCKALRLPVPNILVDSRHSNDTDLHFIIYDCISGQTRDQFVKASGSTSEQRNLFSEIIQTIEQIAQLNIYGYGDLENEREAKHTTYRFFLEYTFEEGIRAAHNSNLLGPSQISKIEKISNKIHDFDVGNTGVLAWADVTPSNIIVNSCGRLAALIDFESVLSSVVDLNLGYCYSRSHNSSFYKRFKEIWEAELGKVDPDIIYFYGLLRLLRILLFSSGHLPINQKREKLEDVFSGSFAAIELIS